VVPVTAGVMVLAVEESVDAGSVCLVMLAPLAPAAAVVPRAPRTTVRVFVLIAVMNIISVPTLA